jgi:DNA topoisomerase I
VPRLRRVSCADPGYTRRRAGKGFVYIDWAGMRVADAELTARFKALAIPPAWTDVWICTHEHGHLQATGVDVKGRRQYIYHPVWREQRDREKFADMLEFGSALPRIRERCGKNLLRPEMDRDRILSCAIRLLDLGFFRIGTEGYAEQNQHYGLATIRKEHVVVDGNMVTFDYVAKSGKRRIQTVVDPTVTDIIRQLKRRRSGGPELLAYKLDGRWRDVKSVDINEYIKQISGADFTAKDFRTWNATVLAAVALAVSEQAGGSKTSRTRAITRAMKEVSHYLGNTPAVCRASYVDPRVIDHYQAGLTIAPALHKLGDGAIFGQLATQGAIEKAVLDLLAEEPADEAAA